jgi:hypothetical protein
MEVNHNAICLRKTREESYLQGIRLLFPVPNLVSPVPGWEPVVGHLILCPFLSPSRFGQGIWFGHNGRCY